MSYWEIKYLGFPYSPRKLGQYEKPRVCISQYDPRTLLVNSKYNIVVFSLFVELAYGSVITLKNHKPGGALLHSHHHLYPKEHPPEYQQVCIKDVTIFWS